MQENNKSIYFHEDDYCQIELLPKENFLLTSNEIGDITRKIPQNFENGYKEITSRSQIRVGLISKSILYNEIQVILKNEALFLFNSVFKGYGEYQEKMSHTFAFGYENYAIFVSLKDDKVSKIWLGYKSFSDTLNIPPVKLGHVLEKIGLKWHLFLVDWNELISINLEKDAEIEDYINNIL